MSFLEYIKTAFINIFGNKGRSFLTMLGIIIGISSVIMITAIGTGFEKTIESQFESLGLDVIMLGMQNYGVSSDEFLKAETADLLKDYPEAEYTAPLVSYYSNEGVDLGIDKSRVVAFNGTTANYNKIMKVDMLHGRFLSETDINNELNNIVIDETLAMQQFGRNDPLGEVLPINMWFGQEDFTIVGVYKDPFMTLEMVEMFGAAATIYISHTTLETFNNLDGAVDQILIKVKNPLRINQIGDDILRLLETINGNEGDEVYSARNYASVLDEVTKILVIFTLFFAVVAGISLFVGGVGVMNIMLVSVTERTREIGIRKALGGTDVDIQLQFLVEAAIITMLGGILGVIFGYLGAFGVAFVINTINTQFELLVSFSTAVIAIATIFSIVVGLVFGVYPAAKASKLNPIDALRYE